MTCYLWTKRQNKWKPKLPLPSRSKWPSASPPIAPIAPAATKAPATPSLPSPSPLRQTPVPRASPPPSPSVTPTPKATAPSSPSRPPVAIRAAEDAAEAATRSARAVADAQYQLLAELDQWTLTPSPAPEAPHNPQQRIAEPSPTPADANSGLTVLFYDTDPVRPYSDASLHARRHQTHDQAAIDEEEVNALEEEIAFRQSPTFDEIDPPTDIPANLIEFPRQLVAPRKARPRLAEGPLREEADHAPNAAQLRIFEVEATQISAAPAVESAAPEWSSILLAAHPASPAAEAPETPYQPVFSPQPAPQTAPFSLRLMASIVDGCIITTALLAFTAVFALTVGNSPAP